MIVRLIKKKQIFNFDLPNKISGNYWITDIDYLGNKRNLINVTELNGQWIIKSDFETKIMSGNNEVEQATLKEYNLYFLKINTDNEYVILYCSPTKDSETINLKYITQKEIIIGNDKACDIYYNYPLISSRHAKLIYINDKWVIQDLNSKYGTYVNNISITRKELEYGDIIFIMGLRIIALKGGLVINKIGDLIGYNPQAFAMEYPYVQTQTIFDNKDEENLEFFKEEDYFYRAPRFKKRIEPCNIVVDAPPARVEEDKTPAIYVIGPMVGMGLTSVLMTTMFFLNGSKSSSPLMSTIRIGLPLLMLISMILWPTLQRRYTKKQIRKKEEIRQSKYLEYLSNKKKEIVSEMEKQRTIETDNFKSLDEVKKVILEKRRNLWEREIEQEDFLSVRIGIGSTELIGNLSFPQEHFSVEKDNLLEEVYKLSKESHMLENVPVTVSLLKNNISAIIGTAKIKKNFIDGIILQLLAYHSYEDLKIIIMTKDETKGNWEYLKSAPHTWQDDKSIRYFSTNIDEAKQLSLILEKELQERKLLGEKLKSMTYANFKPYYLIITDDYKMVRDIDIIKDICSEEKNYGFSLLAISQRLINLPNECKTFISVGDDASTLFENELVSNKQKEFVADFDITLNMNEIVKKIANIPIDITKENRTLPQSLSFLEMYDVGMVEQLNILNRWKTNDPTKSLTVPVGVDPSQELFKLDLHEKYHGPHGLIAGMTGSGKSEFIITYILSMAVNYHPDEVQFVLIDYKGGGLAGAFENKETGIKLPHIAGTITNLDTVEMNRSLASIQSELRKRQRLFNEARDALNESTIDIYKYQSLYRKGLVRKPISHLFIISDEFAELKAQRPEFMEELISTARIGRSLGVHLVLATQKPNGVVNDQIWSNSKFRVCLKVQDKSDSIDMIKVADAAELKNPGRFYLQVGYNELFAIGQAAWGGAGYFPTEKRKKKINQDITIIDNLGNIVKSLTDEIKEQVSSSGEEITNVIKYIVDKANNEKISIEQLWLPKIPNVIYIDDLKEKYSYHQSKYNIEPIIGEYDDPDNQLQNILTLPLSKEGNTIIFGSAGSGKELMLSSLIYSIITNHTPKEVNLYLIDFGAETLTMFKNAPHIGEVLLSSDGEKINNLFKMLNQMMEERKKIFVDYNGSYEFYINHGGKEIPFITVIINNWEAFQETYPDYEDLISRISRDCLKYGIVFILTTSSTNGVRYRLKQNFKQNIALQFNDPGDYASILPGVRRKEPSKIFGRGLIQKESIFEFQTAYPYKEEKSSEYIKIVCKKLREKCKTRALRIPVLPEVVTKEYYDDIKVTMKNIPVGIEKETLNISTIDISSNTINQIIGEDISSNNKFIDGLINVISKMENTKQIVLDTLNLINIENNQNILIEKTNYENRVLSINNLIENIKNNNDNINYIIEVVGVIDLLNKLTPTTREKFKNIIEASKEIKNIRFIFIDTIDNIKTLQYESWYKQNVDLGEGLWLGNGIANQFTIKVTTTSRSIREEIPEDFGYKISKGKPTLIKFISNE